MAILHVCVHYCMMYNVLCTTLCTQYIYIYVKYIHTWVVLCRHIQHIHVLCTGMDEATKFILHTCHVMGLDLLLCEKKSHSLVVVVQTIIIFCSASKLLLRSPAATARSNLQAARYCSCVLYVVYTSVQQLQDPPSLMQQYIIKIGR